MEGIILGLAIFTPIQFIVGLVFSRLLTWSNQGGIGLMFARAIGKIMLYHLDKKKTYICTDCGTDGSKKEAEWACYYTKAWRKEYKGSVVEYFCTYCLFDNLGGVHSGGGPTAASFKKIVRIKDLGDDIIR